MWLNSPWWLVSASALKALCDVCSPVCTLWPAAPVRVVSSVYWAIWSTASWGWSTLYNKVCWTFCEANMGGKDLYKNKIIIQIVALFMDLNLAHEAITVLQKSQTNAGFPQNTPPILPESPYPRLMSRPAQPRLEPFWPVPDTCARHIGSEMTPDRFGIWSHKSRILKVREESLSIIDFGST